MTTLRIYVESKGPLDGLTPLHPEVRSAWNAALGLQEYWVPPGVSLGRLDLGALAPGSEHWIEHLTITCAAGVHQPGAFVGLAAPDLADITPTPSPTIPLVDLGACEETNTGVLTEGLSVPIPAGHALVLQTGANGDAPGPHLIQITLGPVPRLVQNSLPILRPLLHEEPEPEPEPDDKASAAQQTSPERRLEVSFGTPTDPKADGDDDDDDDDEARQDEGSAKGSEP